VVVLVAREGGASGESLLAVGIWALVGSLPTVNTTVTCQGAGIAEGLIVSSRVSFFWVLTREPRHASKSR